jgi:TPR repeat protein
MEKRDYLKRRRYEQLLQSTNAQAALGTRFLHGITVEQDCEASFTYFEAAARMTVEYIERRGGLDSLEK